MAEIAAETHHHGHDVGERLYIHNHTFIHELAPHIKILSGLLFIVVAVSTPISNFYAYICFFILIFLALALAKLSFKTVALRSLIEIPFVLFAFLMPFFGTGPSFELLGFTIYEDGIESGVAIIAKGTLGILTAILISSTTTARELLRGLETLKLPALMVQIASFMLRYINVVNDEMERMRIARASRGFEATGLRHWKVLAHSIGALFIRSYERGERVHLAMISRGYSGLMPRDIHVESSVLEFLKGFSLPLLAFVAAVVTRVIGAVGV